MIHKGGGFYIGGFYVLSQNTQKRTFLHMAIKDRFIIKLKCVYCKHLNKEVIYSAGWIETFDCEKCKKLNYMKPSFRAYEKKENKK